jgi:hypothetical protein
VRLSPHLSELIGDISREGTTVHLRGFSEGDVSDWMVVNAGRGRDPAVAAMLRRATEGTPFFLNEIVRLLMAEGGELARAQSGSGSFFTIPDSVRVAIRRRVSLVSQDAQAALRVGAVVGREFDVEVIRDVAGLPFAQLLAALEEAESYGIITAVADAVGRFSHMLVPETLSRDIAAPMRAELHLRIARTIEARDASGFEQHLAELAHHYTRALPTGSVEKAFEYSCHAARRAAALLAYEDAARLYEMAIAALESRQPVDEELRSEVLLARWCSRVSPARSGYTASCGATAQPTPDHRSVGHRGDAFAAPLSQRSACAAQARRHGWCDTRLGGRTSHAPARE